MKASTIMLTVLVMSTMIACEPALRSSVEEVAPAMREIPSSEKFAKKWELTQASFSTSFTSLLNDAFTENDILQVGVGQAHVEVTIYEGIKFGVLEPVVLYPKKNLDRIVCAEINAARFAHSVRSEVEQGHHLEIWYQDGTYYARLIE